MSVPVVVPEAAPSAPAAAAKPERRRWRRDPWHKPRFLAGFTWAYLAWSIVPVAIVGAFECWPRTRLLPRPGRIRLEFGAILSAAEVAALSEREIFAICTQRIRELDAKARAALGATARSRPAVSSPRGPV